MYGPNFIKNKFSSSTKLFEALFFKKPIILSKNTYLDKIVEDYDCGWTCDYNLDSLLKLLKVLTKKEIEEKALKTFNLYKKIKWKNSEKRLKDLYLELIV